MLGINFRRKPKLQTVAMIAVIAYQGTEVKAGITRHDGKRKPFSRVWLRGAAGMFRALSSMKWVKSYRKTRARRVKNQR